MQHNLQNELLGVETKILAEQKSLEQSKGTRSLLNAPDVYHMIAMLQSFPISNGSGERLTFFELVISSDPKKI